MMRQTKPESPGPPGVISTIAAGFDLITSHLWLILLPVLLDLLLWLGPRLGAATLMQQNLSLLADQEMFAAFVEQGVALAPRINMLTMLSFPVIGVPALMTGPTPERTPIPAAVLEVASMPTWSLLFILLNVAGLLLAVLYYNLLAHTLRGEPFDLAAFARRLARSALKLFGLVLIFGLSLAAVGVVLLPVSLILALFGLGPATLIFLSGAAAMWLAIYLSFSIHGIVLDDAGIFPAMLTSVRLVQTHIWPALLLLLGLILVGSGLNTLWRQVDNGSWLTLVSLFGHGFISTALVMSTFVFYRARVPRDHTPAPLS